MNITTRSATSENKRSPSSGNGAATEQQRPELFYTVFRTHFAEELGCANFSLWVPSHKGERKNVFQRGRKRARVKLTFLDDNHPKKDVCLRAGLHRGF